MAVWYLDNDDEITDAVARLRGTSDEHVVFVVPPGSRIATGRINFRLLAREAEARDLKMAVASPDEQVRALAVSAGVLADPTPDGAAAALARGDQPAQPADEPDGAPGSPRAIEPTTASAGAAATRSGRGRLAATVVLLLGVVIVGGYLAAPTISTAEITLTPRTSPVGPIEVEVVAAPGVAAVDVAAGRIPASTVTIPLRAAFSYEASGEESVETRATGEVVFTSPDQERDKDILAGTRLQTPAGVVFRTTESVTLDRATGPTPSTVSARVEAVEPGPGGNVPAGAITIVPSLESQGITVRNPEATSGGRVERDPLVTSGDYDDAAVDLRNRLEGALDAFLRDPDSVPEGLVLYPESVRWGMVQLDPPAEALLGRHEATFELAATVNASALAADPRLAAEVTRVRLGDAVGANVLLLPDSVSIEVGDGLAEGDRIRFIGTASALGYPRADAAELSARIAGLPIPEARAILEGVGSTTVTVWPEFLADLPGDPDRITLEVREPATTE